MAFDFIPKIVYGTGPTTITFTYPPRGIDAEGKSVIANARVTESANGKQQTTFLHNEEEREVTLEMLTQAQVDALDTFFQTHAALGKEFDYYPHKDEVTSKVTVTLTRRTRVFRPQRMTPGGLFRVQLLMRRAL